jgi:hypothetical protein
MPRGLLTPSPLTKAAPSSSANSIDTSSASHCSTLKTESSSAVCVAAG